VARADAAVKQREAKKQRAKRASDRPRDFAVQRIVEK